MEILQIFFAFFNETHISTFQFEIHTEHMENLMDKKTIFHALHQNVFSWYTYAGTSSLAYATREQILLKTCK